MITEYEKLRSELQNLPLTWYPDLIRVIIQAAVKKGVFKVGGASRFLRECENTAQWSEPGERES